MRDSPEPNAPDGGRSVPWMQRLLERPFVLLALGLLVMFLFYTGWGWFEIHSLPQSPLP